MVGSAPAERASASEVPDVSAFFSGRYQTEGINVQAMCDSACRSTGYCIKSPGKVSDVVAFKKWELSTTIASLPSRFYCIGDNAYILSEHMLVPFNKLELSTRARSDLNFYIFNCGSELK